MAYDENSIRILSAIEIADRFGWLRAETLAREYNQPVEWVKRGFEASRRLGIEPDFFIEKYILKQDKPKNPEFEQIFREILLEVKNT